MAKTYTDFLSNTTFKDDPIRSILKSQEEVWFYDWCYILKKHGIITKIVYEPDPIELTPAIWSEGIIGKKKVKKCVERAMQYTTDFLIEWNPEFLGTMFINLQNYYKNQLPLITHVNNSYTTLIEVKPTFDQNNMTRVATDRIKFTYHIHGIYINIIMPPDFFKVTFSPYSYFYTKAGNERKLSKYFQPSHQKTFEQYFKTLSL